VDTTLLRHFLAAAEQPDFARAAAQLNVSRKTLSMSIKALENQVGFPLFDRDAESTTLTQPGQALLADARLELAASVAKAKAAAPNTGGKAKASKGQGRAPAVKGQPRPGKKRQSR